MKPLGKRIETFGHKHPLAGPALWIASLQYFIVTLAAALAWPAHYSFLHNTISDLGNTACGSYGSRYVCSPDHAWFNLSLVVLGLTQAAGAALIYRWFKKSRASAAGFSFMALAGMGTLLVGCFPENTISGLHELGAALPFIFGNLSLVVLGLALRLSKIMRVYTVASGIVALAALVLFVASTYLGLGIGGMERLTANLQTVWLIVFGVYLVKNSRKF